MALLATVVCRFGFFGGRIAQSDSTRSPFEGVLDGLRAARTNPRLALSYGSAFAARGVLVVVGMLMIQWKR